MKIRHLKRASIARTLARIRYEPDRRALMERGLRASYFGLAKLVDRRRRKRQFRPVLVLHGGLLWPPRTVEDLARRNPVLDAEARAFFERQYQAAPPPPLEFNRLSMLW